MAAWVAKQLAEEAAATVVKLKQLKKWALNAPPTGAAFILCVCD